MNSSFDDLIAEGNAVDVSGWDFSWLNGRATEERPPWGYVHLLGQRLSTVEASLDLQTGGGEVLAQAPAIPRLAVATESFPPNIAKATELLHPRGIAVVADPDEPPLPFADRAFDLVSSRHPATIWWDEIHRVLRPGGSYLGQHVGPASVFELIEYFLGPQPQATRGRDPQEETAAARNAGLEIVDLREARLRIEIHDISAVVFLLRKIIWWIPDFSVAAYRDRLKDLHDLIQSEGPFIAHSTRHLVESTPTRLRVHQRDAARSTGRRENGLYGCP